MKNLKKKDFIYLFERERKRERTSQGGEAEVEAGSLLSRGPPPTPMSDLIPEYWDHDLT